MAIECVSSACGNTSDTATGATWKKGASTYFRCHTCGRTNNRIREALHKLPEEAAQRWQATSKEQKAEFRDRNKETLIEDMPAALTTYVTESFQELESCAANAKGLFKDKADLTEKYSKKPDQLQANFEDAKTMQFSTVSAKATETRRVLKRVAEQREEKLCARAQRKKAKVENAEDAGEASTRPTGPAPTPLSESQKVRATKLLARMTAATE